MDAKWLTQITALIVALTALVKACDKTPEEKAYTALSESIVALRQENDSLRRYVLAEPDDMVEGGDDPSDPEAFTHSATEPDCPHCLVPWIKQEPPAVVAGPVSSTPLAPTKPAASMTQTAEIFITAKRLAPPKAVAHPVLPAWKEITKLELVFYERG